jgi:hypothetical protein
MKYQDDYHYDYYAEHKEETRVANKKLSGKLFLVAVVGVFLFIMGSCVHSCMTAPTHEEKMQNDPEYAEIYNRIHHRNLREKRNAERIEAYKDACDELGIPYEE